MNCIMRLDIRYISWFSITKKIILKKIINLNSLGLPNKISSCEVSALKVNKTVEHDKNLVLGGFKDCYSNLAGNLLKNSPNPQINLL